MRVTVVIGREKLRIPVDEGSRTLSWLQAEVIRRWERMHKGDYLHIKEIRTVDNIRLDNEDQIFAVCKEDESLVVITGEGTGTEVGPGDMINQYYLQELIGEGTYGRVYRAHDLNLNRAVAVKVLRREKANAINTRRFLREAELNGSLSHNPYVVTVHDHGRTRGGALFIVMELLRGRPLNELLDERINADQPFSVIECIHIMAPVLRGLHAAHTHKPPIVHRDLKPDNIWINDMSRDSRPHDLVAKLMDFGIAIHDEITHETLACGTRMYSSPEQTRRHAKLDGRSDIWSCGVLLYQMLSLLVDVPFDPIDLILNRGRVPPLSSHTRTPLSRHMHDVVMRALEMDPSARWQSAEEMGDALAFEEQRLLNPNKRPTITFPPNPPPAPKPHQSDASREEQQQHQPSQTVEANGSDSADIAASAAPLPLPLPASSSSSGASAASTPAAAAAPSEAELHPRYRSRRRRPFASGETEQLPLPSKL